MHIIKQIVGIIFFLFGVWFALLQIGMAISEPHTFKMLMMNFPIFFFVSLFFFILIEIGIIIIGVRWILRPYDTTEKRQWRSDKRRISKYVEYAQRKNGSECQTTIDKLQKEQATCQTSSASKLSIHPKVSCVPDESPIGHLILGVLLCLIGGWLSVMVISAIDRALKTNSMLWHNWWLIVIIIVMFFFGLRHLLRYRSLSKQKYSENNEGQSPIMRRK